MYKYIRISIILLMLISAKGYSQSLQSYEQKAIQSFKQMNYSAALAYYDVLLSVAPNRTDALYYGAESARLLRSYTIAESYYSKIADSEKKDPYQLTDFWLAEVKKGLHKYEEAADIYQRFLNNYPQADRDFRDQAQIEISNCKWAIKSQLDPADVEIVHFDKTINSTYPDLAPLKSGDLLYFTSVLSDEENKALQEGETQFYSSTYNRTSKKDPVMRLFSVKEGETAKPMEGFPFEVGSQTAHITFNKDGNRMYYNVCRQRTENMLFHCKIYYRDRQSDGSWGAPMELPGAVNDENFTATQPSIGEDASGKECLFFASDRAGGKGKLDIWCSERQSDGSFGNPVNLSDINTDGDDLTPYFYAPSQTLFFSSDGLSSMGGYDIFRSQKIDGSWEAPSNLGAPFNTGYDDLYYTFNDKDGMGYFSSNRPGNYCISAGRDCVCNDLYSYKVSLSLNALTFNELSLRSLIGTTVKLIDMNTGQIDTFQFNDVGNDFHFPLSYGKDYVVIATKDQYRSDSLSLSTKGLTESKVFNEKLNLLPRVKLEVFVYDAFDLEPIDSATVQMDESNNIAFRQIRQNPTKNDFYFDVFYNRKYHLKANREGYGEALKTINIPDVDTPLVVRHNIYLPRFEEIPLTLYYDNDYPTPNSWDSTTVYSYDQTYTAYMKRRTQFITETCKGLSGEERERAMQDMIYFFDLDVKENFDKLISISENLLTYLKNGFELQIILEGYASPLAKSEYNKILTQRRIDCIVNFYENYNNGVFKEYLDNKSLVFYHEPKGEDEAEKDVIDSPDNVRESIYSVKASKERRVRIIDVKKQSGILTILKTSGKKL